MRAFVCAAVDAKMLVPITLSLFNCPCAEARRMPLAVMKGRAVIDPENACLVVFVWQIVLLVL